MNFDTRSVTNRDRFAYWREAVCATYVQLGCEAVERRNFKGSITLERLPQISISFVSGTSHDVIRRKQDISRATDEFFLLSLQLKKKAYLSQRERIAELGPGDFALYSSTDHYKLTLTDSFEQLVLQMPKKQLLARMPNADLLTGRRISGNSVIGKLVGQSVLGFARAENNNRIIQSFIQDTLIDLVATGLSSIDEGNCELSLPEQHMSLRARTFIQSNLMDPALDRNAVAQATGISVRRLNEIFMKEGYSISGFIRSARLDRAASDLKDPRFQRQSISELAMKWGFNNFQHFSRIFRETYGKPPSEFRSAKASYPKQ
nr:helix-turn-helix domain-containing protein [Sneathiella litorea]